MSRSTLRHFLNSLYNMQGTELNSSEDQQCNGAFRLHWQSGSLWKVMCPGCHILHQAVTSSSIGSLMLETTAA